MNPIGTALSAMQAGMARLNASAANIANANSTGPVPGGPPSPTGAQVYRPVRVQQSPLETGGVASQVVRDSGAYRLRYDPASPDADAAGMIAAPDVDVVSELVEQIVAKLSFNASLSMFRAVDEMQGRLVDRFA